MNAKPRKNKVRIWGLLDAHESTVHFDHLMTSKITLPFPKADTSPPVYDPVSTLPPGPQLSSARYSRHFHSTIVPIKDGRGVNNSNI